MRHRRQREMRISSKHSWRDIEAVERAPKNLGDIATAAIPAIDEC
jgi:hypothetical protein